MEITIRLASLADASAMVQVHMRSWEVAYRGLIDADYICVRMQTRLQC